MLWRVVPLALDGKAMHARTMRRGVVLFGLVVGLASGCQRGGAAQERSSSDAVPDLVLDPRPAAGPDLATDPAVREAYRKQTGQPLSEDACIERPSRFPHVVLIGSFAHDAGCSTSNLFINGTLADRLKAGGWSEQILMNAGFGAMDSQAKRELARAYVDQVAHAFGGRFVTDAVPAFDLDDTPSFSAVVTEDVGDGVVIKGWTFVPPGMVDESRFVFMTYNFTADGQVTAQRGEDFSVAGERLR